MTIDTLKVAKRLREAGFSEPQAEAVISAVQEGTASADLATKADITALRSELREAELATKADIAALRSETKADIAALRSELRETELRLEAKIEAIKADILNRVFGLILGTPRRQHSRNRRRHVRRGEGGRPLSCEAHRGERC
jgi:DNA-binding transcriptional MerR regulator